MKRLFAAFFALAGAFAQTDIAFADAPSTIAAPRPIYATRVPGDLPAFSVDGARGEKPVTVFLHGLCGHGLYYLQTFENAARAAGGVLAVQGDIACSTGGYRQYSWDAGKLNARIEATLAAAGHRDIPKEGITVIGYSQGAALAEQLVERWPDRYPRAVLIGSPNDPSPKRLARARGIVTMSCSFDVTVRMKKASVDLAKAGVPSTYVQMPGCTHGAVADGERAFGEALGFLRDHEKPLPSGIAPVPLLGPMAAP